MNEHFIIYAKDGRYAGWPANVGAWSWGDELLVGFTEGEYRVEGIHNCQPPFGVMFARSLDGGGTWMVEEPLVDWEGDPQNPVEIDFSHPDLALRFVGTLDHFACSATDGGAYFVSYDRGRKWIGPFVCSGYQQPSGSYCSTRTSYIKELGLVFFSFGFSGGWGADKAFCARYEDRKFRGLSALTKDDPRAVMPSVVYINDKLFAALRRRHRNEEQCWIELVTSVDKGETWFSLGRAAETGGTAYNGNPPALAVQSDKLVLTYGNRDAHQMRMRVSDDWGKSWRKPVTFRDDFYAALSGYGDLGYPQLLKRADGSLLCAYYWATDEHTHQHIAGTILSIQ